MSPRPLAFAVAFASLAVLVLASIVPPATVAAAGPNAQAALQAGDVSTVTTAVQQCIPCSAKKPCLNPLTVCTYNSQNHGCCLGYAGQN